MIEINLVPQEFRIREIKPSRAFSVIITVSAFALIGIGIASSIQQADYKKQVALAQENLKAIQITTNEVKNITNTLNSKLRPEAEAIKGMLSNEINWAEVLEVLGEHIPSNIWLSELTISDTSERWEIVVNGFALPVADSAAIATVGTFTNAVKGRIEELLRTEKITAKVELLTTTKQKQADKLEIVEFKAEYQRYK